MADVILQAEPPTLLGSRNAGRIRREGLLPAVVYGLESKSVPVTAVVTGTPADVTGRYRLSGLSLWWFWQDCSPGAAKRVLA